MEFDGVWTLSFAADNADNEFHSFTQEIVVALEEVKRRSSSETAQFYTHFSFPFHETEKTTKLHKSENSEHCLIIRKRIPVKCTTNV